MASCLRSRPSSFSPSDQWFLMTATICICAYMVLYVIYDAIMATVSDFMQRLMVISPLLLVIAIHWLSTGRHLISLPIPGSEPGAIHRAGGSPWGLTFVLLLLFFLISHHITSLHGLCYIFIFLFYIFPCMV
ncbi:hypothetical protein I3760_12G017900 [Carya illinoinensis]|nr:hypothetical protein I3760_12G017900 [Carya illinoinensis]